MTASSSPTRPQIVSQAARLTDRRLSTAMITRCKKLPPGMLDPEEMEVMAEWSNNDPGFKEAWIPRVRLMRSRGQARDPDFQSAFQAEVFSVYSDALTDPECERLHEHLYAYFYPVAGTQNFRDYNPGLFVSELATEGNFAIISGPEAQEQKVLGVGKTHHMVWCFEQLYMLKQEHALRGKHSNLAYLLGRGGGQKTPRDPQRGELPSGLANSTGVRFMTNASVVPPSEWGGALEPDEAERLYACFGFEGDTERRVAFSKMTEYMLGSICNSRAGAITYWGWDEAGNIYEKRRAMSAINLGIRQNLTSLRKVNTALLAVTQQSTDQLPDDFLGQASTQVTKLTEQVGIVTIAGFRKHQRFYGFPPVSIGFRTKAFAAFKMDLDPMLMFQFVTDKEQEARANREEWNDTRMLNVAEAWLRDWIRQLAAFNARDNPLLRQEINLRLDARDPATNRPFSDEEIARDVEASYADEETGEPSEGFTFRELLRKVKEERRKRRIVDRASRKAGRPEPPRIAPDDNPEYTPEGQR